MGKLSCRNPEELGGGDAGKRKESEFWERFWLSEKNSFKNKSDCGVQRRNTGEEVGEMFT